MPLGIEEVLRPALRSRSTRFVFPSEVCAEAWLAASLREGPGALESDRFLGWDRLKELAATADGRVPADDCLRRIFAASLLAANAEGPFLSTVLNPAYAGTWRPFADYVASRLPALGRLPEALGSLSEIPAAADWLAIRRRYESFLRGIGRFEPSYEPRSLRSLEGTTFIFFPELIEDFEEYRSSLTPGPSLRLISLPGHPTGARLRRPETALAELRMVLSEIGELLDSGADAESVAITVPGLDRYRPYLEREAALLSVPLAVRSGSRLVSTPGGRLFAALRDASSSGFAFDSLRDLLLSPAWPWKDPGLGRGIMAEGQRLHAVASWSEGGRPRDVWELSLTGELLRGYRRLKSRIGAIVAAADFRSILKAYNAFRSEFLSSEREAWDSGADLTLARCVVELEGLVRAQAASGLEVKDAFGIFMRGLESKPYVSSGGGTAGVPVYEWRVAAGIRPERHFVLHASQDALSVPYRGFDYLGESLRERLGAVGDAAPAFIEAYALSGEEVVFSCPEAGFAGEEAAHGFLLSISGEEIPERKADASYSTEAAWLSGRGPEPARLHRVQALGLRAAASAPAFAPSEGAFLLPEAAAVAAARLSRRRGTGDELLAGIDSTSIDHYLACPYSYLYLRLLDAGPRPSGVSFVDALFIGEVYHAALALLFERIRDADLSFKPERAAEYRSLVGPCVSESFASLSRQRGAFVGVVLEAYRGRLERYLENLIAAEASRFPDLEIGPIEEELELEYPEAAGGVVLRGRIDRISRSDRGAVVIDYKKGGLPSRSQVAPDEEGAIAEAQIPAYLRLLDAKGEAIDSAWYVSIEGDARREAGSAACAFGDSADEGKEAYVERSRLEGFLRAFDAALEATVDGIFAGAYPLAPKETQKTVCIECGIRGICRERYALRFGSSPGARREGA